ncbi:hypothetical protein F0562_019262 [Nyssa sinensis]|uniref:Glycosyltransferase n=1 Tax=Nyssa sinensis TaxID=561372 RepID=A0A5J4ZBI0_9ASTE|nr:hypothetical protein F0562_019262 [Nyssa sinensis]
MVKDIHVVMLPWSAFGHLMPFLELSIGLAKAGVHVSFVSTPKNIQRLPKLPPDVSALINLVALPLPAVDRNLLPEDAEATVDIPFEKIQYLKVAYDLLQQPVKQFIAEQSPDWIVVDFSPHWAVEIAQEYGIPLINFYVFSAAATVFFGPPEYLTGDNRKRIRPSPESMTSPPEWVTFPSLVAYRNYEAIGFHPGLFGENASGITDAQRLAKLLDASQAVAVRSCKEFEEEYLNLLPKIMGKPVIPVGLLPPEKPEEREFTDGSWIKIFKWLEEQTPKSVVFVGFGSECKLNKDQIYEIAYGLELSELPFLWALRKPSWAIDDQDALPLGFSHRTSGKGVVHIGWAPQVEILGHPSVGGSLFHSGWGSVIETLQYGHCLVVLPFIVDQGLNARLLEEKGLATEVPRSEGGAFNRDGIAKSLRQAMISEEEQPLRDRTREVAGIFSDRKLHDNYVDGPMCSFVEAYFLSNLLLELSLDGNGISKLPLVLNH